MKKKYCSFLFIIALCTVMAHGQGIDFIPIEHASLIIKSGDDVIFIDPVGDLDNYSSYKPNIILITHKHFDHLNEELVEKAMSDNTTVLGPVSVIEKLSFGNSIKNGESKVINSIKIDAIAMYNTTDERLKYHPKGDGNGYVVTLNNERIYIAGDTEDIPEMRELSNIDHAFICMNLPYTMTVDQAISATLAFKPKVAYPYHYRGKKGKSDVDRYKKEVEAKSETIVKLLSWY